MRWSHVSPRAASPTNRQLPLSLLPPLLLKSPSFRNPRAGADAATRRLTTRRPENRRAIPRPRHSSSASRRSLEGCAASARPEARPPGAGLRIAAASQTCNDFYRGTRSLNRDHGPLAWPCDFSGAPPCRNALQDVGGHRPHCGCIRHCTRPNDNADDGGGGGQRDTKDNRLPAARRLITRRWAAPSARQSQRLLYL